MQSGHARQYFLSLVILSRRGSQLLFSVKYLLEKQLLPIIFSILRTAKNFQMTIPFMSKFRSLPYKFLLKFNRSHFTPQVKLFFVQKGNLWRLKIDLLLSAALFQRLHLLEETALSSNPPIKPVSQQLRYCRKQREVLLFATKSVHVSCFTSQGKLVLQQMTKSRIWRDSRVIFVQSVVSIHTTCDNLICCKKGSNGGRKTRNIAFNTFCSSIPKQVFRLRCPFYRSLTLLYPFIHRGLWRQRLTLKTLKQLSQCLS